MIGEWANMIPIAKEKRVKSGELAICKGSCNSLKKIAHTKYQLCGTCKDKFRWLGNECDVPFCEQKSDGSIEFHLHDNKILCTRCYWAWKGRDYCIWERFLEDRQSHFLRPQTYVKALEEGLIAPVKNPVKAREVAECQFCYKYQAISLTKYQLCGTCSRHLQYHGEKCSIKDCSHDGGISYDLNESRLVCNQCQDKKSKYGIPSYMIYETQIRTIKNCGLCEREVSHNRKEGEKHCSAIIDHDHDTGEIRGVLCSRCNIVEGSIKKMPISPHAYVRRLSNYLENQPLSKSLIKKN